MHQQSSKVKRGWQVLKSVAASAFGVQSQANYEHDFRQSSVVPYVVVGVVFVVCFVLALMGLVNWLTP